MKDKVAFITHPYHRKTKSCDFMIDYLKEFYDVEVIYNDSEEINDISSFQHVDNTYNAAIFWQIFPLNGSCNKIENNNIILFPMFDHIRNWNFEKWSYCKNIKLVCFSKKLHTKLQKAGFNSMYLQYFIEPKEFCTGNNNEVLFWQRLSSLSFNTVKQILPKGIKLHLHNAVDPTNEYVKPSVEDEKEYEITYSSWFEDKQEMIDLIKSKSIYIAPRFREGIGLSFLEAMAQGKAVIAHNEATMNEYIIHGETGYLCDFEKPKKIDLTNIEQVQKNAYSYMKKGYSHWQKNKINIINFVNKKPQKQKATTFLQKLRIFLVFADKKDIIRLKFGSKGYFKLFGAYLINKEVE